jgi:site-specific DNA-cytosine methylase
MDRIKALGNGVIPQIAEWIAQRIKAVLEQEGNSPKESK